MPKKSLADWYTKLMNRCSKKYYEQVIKPREEKRQSGEIIFKVRS